MIDGYQEATQEMASFAALLFWERLSENDTNGLSFERFCSKPFRKTTRRGPITTRIFRF